MSLYIHGKNSFAMSKNLAGYRSENNFVCQNNYVKRLNIDKAVKSFNIPAQLV